MWNFLCWWIFHCEICDLVFWQGSWKNPPIFTSACFLQRCCQRAVLYLVEEETMYIYICISRSAYVNGFQHSICQKRIHSHITMCVVMPKKDIALFKSVCQKLAFCLLAFACHWLDVCDVLRNRAYLAQQWDFKVWLQFLSLQIYLNIWFRFSLSGIKFCFT